MQTSPEKSFVKPVEHLEKSDKSDKQKVMAIANDARSERSSSVQSSGSRHHTIEQDIEAKLHETEKPRPTVTKSIIQQYLEQQSAYFSQYTAIDITRQFNHAQYIHWRHNAQKVNQYHDQLQKGDTVILQKYVLDSMLKSQQVQFDLNQKAYFEYRYAMLPYFEYLNQYVMNCIMNSMDCSYVGYEYYANFMRQRQMLVGEFRKEVMRSNKVSYSQEIFDQFVMDPNCHFNLEAYEQYFEQMEHNKKVEEREQLEIQKQQLKKLEEEVENLNLFIYNEFIESCSESGIEPTKEGYRDYEVEMRKQYAQEYLKEKHEKLEAETEKMLKAPEEKRGIQNTIDEFELEFLKKNGQVLIFDEEGAQFVDQDSAQENAQEKAPNLNSRECKCCGGNPDNCQGEACAFIGQCICQTDY